MTWWDDKAVRWQERTRSDEIDRGNDYSESVVRRATVHTREDIIMVVALLSALNRQASTIKIVLVILTIAIVYIAARISFR
jgi:hypothetical protein